MKIEVGKSYKTRDGRKVTVLDNDGSSMPWRTDDEIVGPWRYADGSRFGHGNPSDHDLVAEWTEPDADDWIEWKGGECPVPGKTMVEVRFRAGDQETKPAATWALCWNHDGWDEDIVAYRTIRSDEKTVLTVEKESALDVQVGGQHYKSMPIQPIEYIHANGLGFAEGCVVKYVTRWKAKNGIADLEKARHFLDLLIELESRKESK
jgi:hypothetical protein